MKLEKAIEIVSQETKTYKLLRNPDLTDALKLLIEAGKRIKLGRKGVQRFAHTLLPGETRD